MTGDMQISHFSFAFHLVYNLYGFVPSAVLVVLRFLPCLIWVKSNMKYAGHFSLSRNPYRPFLLTNVTLNRVKLLINVNIKRRVMKTTKYFPRILMMLLSWQEVAPRERERVHAGPFLNIKFIYLFLNQGHYCQLGQLACRKHL